MKKQEYTKLSERDYKGYNYTAFKLKYPAGVGGDLMENGIYHYRVDITKNGLCIATTFAPEEGSLKRHAEKAINGDLGEKNDF